MAPDLGDDGLGGSGLLALAAALACVLEASAEKVGNVTPTRAFADARFGDFVAGALALAPAIAEARPGRVGRAVWKAIDATRRVTPSNTQLGVALLFAPVAAAWTLECRAGRAGESRLRSRLRRVLRGLSVEDARWVYRAIRAARPGGLGESQRADVRQRPTVTLRQAMALAADRDSIAREYTQDFALTFTIVLPALRRAIARGLSGLEAIAQAHLELLARIPDTLIARKAGRLTAQAVAARADRAVRAGGWHTRKGRTVVARLDRWLRRGGNRLNPGTSADLVAVALFLWLLRLVTR